MQRSIIINQFQTNILWGCVCVCARMVCLWWFDSHGRMFVIYRKDDIQILSKIRPHCIICFILIRLSQWKSLLKSISQMWVSSFFFWIDWEDKCSFSLSPPITKWTHLRQGNVTSVSKSECIILNSKSINSFKRVRSNCRNQLFQ